MKNLIKSNNINDLYKKIILEVLKHGKKIAPRGMNTIEIINFSFTLTNPKESIITLTERKMNYGFMTIERLEHLSGESNVNRVLSYNSKMGVFVNEETRAFDGAYGPRIKLQLFHCYELLKKDQFSRQAVVTIRDKRDIIPSRDIPCTISLQFFIRDGKLSMITTMRSNDVFLGIPYDIASFCFIQRHLAMWLGVEVGDYHHNAGSMHIYEYNIEKLKNIAISTETNIIENELIGKNYIETIELVNKFFKIEKSYRDGNFDCSPNFFNNDKGLKIAVKMIYDYNQRKQSKN